MIREKQVIDIIQRFQYLNQDNDVIVGTLQALKSVIQSLPTTDKIICCKDCIHFYDHDCPIDWGITEGDFCSWAEEK